MLYRNLISVAFICLIAVFAGQAMALPALMTDSCDSMYPGNADGSGEITWEDVAYLNNYLCRGGPMPNPLANGDANGDCLIDSADIAYLENFLLTGQNPPVDCTCLNPATGGCVHDFCLGQKPGDANGDTKLNVGDAVYLIQLLCSGGPAPVPLANGDYTGDCVIDSMDVYASFMYVWKCKGADKCGYPAPVPCTCEEPVIGAFFQDPCFGARSGDANDDGKVDIGDAVYLINYIFKSGPSPRPYSFYSGDANHDCQTNIGDAIFIINGVFKGGPMPGGCDEWIQSCGRCVDLVVQNLFLQP